MDRQEYLEWVVRAETYTLRANSRNTKVKHYGAKVLRDNGFQDEDIKVAMGEIPPPPPPTLRTDDPIREVLNAKLLPLGYTEKEIADTLLHHLQPSQS